MAESKNKVRVGVGVFILHPSSTPSNPLFLMGKRLVPHGHDQWANPEGHLEFGETLEECAVREVLEETGLVFQKDEIKFLTATNSLMEAGPRRDGKEGMEGKHYVAVWMVGTWDGKGEGPRNLEGDKNGEWEWVGLEETREWAGVDGMLFQPVIDLLRERGEVLHCLV
ncbi:hypothetical protein BOTCAL_0068g00220 [Botryotinia calthae]|uniref:Nudix hydrolase domain-containing protein n=1 Tax=Botryotinia calthae TaxID=38488 RepID=A0A4Y8DBK4_9HELO|nr:hypothetical protein BOTCAL_0068g00220 [Botryotinia calthae]